MKQRRVSLKKASSKFSSTVLRTYFEKAWGKLDDDARSNIMQNIAADGARLVLAFVRVLPVAVQNQYQVAIVSVAVQNQ